MSGRNSYFTCLSHRSWGKKTSQEATLELWSCPCCFWNMKSKENPRCGRVWEDENNSSILSRRRGKEERTISWRKKRRFLVRVWCICASSRQVYLTNYQRKSYRTRCSCMTNIISGGNKYHKIKQVCECLWDFFLRSKDTQVMAMKEWIQNGMNFVKKLKKSQA